ncbi:rhodanese-like domain-containing protein [Saccharothrix sp.]|uniref:MBL fold metallo-hydrolase n=1 Tax=Saccharothrix sp. TaxID=1873460 RepID=UPI002811473C|nr:rhodanese-like domain-containing protein [Saccharothrix sp.]
MAVTRIVPLVDAGLGNSAYLVDLGDGRALAVDVSRDLRAVEREAARRKLTVAFAADTHLHADFLSGARKLGTWGARVLASAAGGREFAHEGLHDGDEVDLGGLTLRALATPGHTHEHLSLLLSDGSRPLGVFTGGSLLVGSAARTDLVAPDRTEELARAQYASLHRLTTLPDEVSVWPTHGGGSFCAAPAGGERVSTIGREKTTNPLLRVAGEDEFVAALLGPLGSYPAYFRWLGEVNRRGPALHDPALPALDVDRVRALLAEGAQLVDVRPMSRYAAAHVPGSLSIPLRPVFATWLGWLAAPDRPLVVLRDPDQDGDEIRWQALKIGYDNLAGELVGLDAWTAAGHPTAATRLVSPHEVSGRVLDVRQHAEFTAGHLPGATHVELGDLPARAADLPHEPTVVMCGHGERALGAASVLEHAGHRDLAVLTGGPRDWARDTGGTVVTGS